MARWVFIIKNFVVGRQYKVIVQVTVNEDTPIDLPTRLDQNLDPPLFCYIEAFRDESGSEKGKIVLTSLL